MYSDKIVKEKMSQHDYLCNAANKNGPGNMVDERFECLSVIFRLAGSVNYNNCNILLFVMIYLIYIFKYTKNFGGNYDEESTRNNR